MKYTVEDKIRDIIISHESKIEFPHGYEMMILPTSYDKLIEDINNVVEDNSGEAACGVLAAASREALKYVRTPKCVRDGVVKKNHDSAK